MKIKTSELADADLDRAVAKCEGWKYVWWKPSTNWSQGGPIIEREGIEVGRQHDEWIACSEVADDGNWDKNVCYGPTPLIAAMRCYVTSKLGDEVEIPDELNKREGIQHSDKN